MAERKGIGGHQSAAAGTVTWLTPPEIIAELGGPDSFDLDPCGGPFRGPFRTARRMLPFAFYDGLAVPWAGRVWLNPPYTTGEIGDWLGRLADHGQGTALIFARTETEAFQRQVFERASGLLFLAGRLHFHHGDGTRAKANAGAPSVLCAYGPDDLDRLAASGLPGHLAPLQFARFVVVAGAELMETTWRAAVLDFVKRNRGPVRVSDLYRHFARHPKAQANPNWRAKVRQTLQRLGAQRVGPGEWSVAHA